MSELHHNKSVNNSLFDYLLCIGDDLLILGHRLSEWCGRGPILEEDIALTNIALDCIGGASALLQFAGQIEGKGRTEDDLAFFREAVEFKNLQMLELPNGDFAFTIARQFLFDTFGYFLFGELSKSTNKELASIASKLYKEVVYHQRHSTEWVYRLGDGTHESHSRLQSAFDELWMYTGELFSVEECHLILLEEKIIPDLTKVKPQWHERISEILSNATIAIMPPEEDLYFSHGSRRGLHTEYLGHLLSEMQILARSFPGAKW
ncbi:MAG: 1,2-phenylacetyl-CoA epoxidase subunit PaaC [Clostridiales bacterium]